MLPPYSSRHCAFRLEWSRRRNCKREPRTCQLKVAWGPIPMGYRGLQTYNAGHAHAPTTAGWSTLQVSAAVRSYVCIQTTVPAREHARGHG